MFHKRQKEEEIEYRDEYFYTLGSWWVRSRDGHYEGCQRVNKDQVPDEYLKHFGQEPIVVYVD